jgi:hypothetical protein
VSGNFDLLREKFAMINARKENVPEFDSGLLHKFLVGLKQLTAQQNFPVAGGW